VLVLREAPKAVRPVLASAGTTVSTPIGEIRPVSDEDPDPDVSCGFCGKSRRRVAAMAAAGEARICDECLSLCDEI
jgi:hypothetical protein